MPFQPSYSESRKLPTFSSSDKSLEEALNTLARAIEAIQIPDVRITGGQSEWSGKTLMLRPQKGRTYQAVEDHPWKPYYGMLEGNPAVGFQLGTINNVVPTNWNEMHDHGITDEETFKFIVLTVTADNGKVTGAVISLDVAAPETDNGSVSIPPTEFKIVLGAVGMSRYYMAEKLSLTYVPTEIFKETKAAPAVGAEPFDRWYSWQKAQLVEYVW